MKFICATCGLVVLLMNGFVFSLYAEEIEPLNSWIGKTRDETHLNAAPVNGIIQDQEAFETLWGKWHPGDDLPKVDFDKEMILTATVEGPNRISIIGLHLMVAK
jgi:hypothetical protein